MGIDCAELVSGRSNKASKMQVLTMTRGRVFMVKLLKGRVVSAVVMWFYSNLFSCGSRPVSGMEALSSLGIHIVLYSTFGIGHT